jgi:hypothetical protein
VVPIVQRTVDIVAVPRFKEKPVPEHDTVIDVPKCLSLLHICALGCVHSEQHIRHFWQWMRWDFIGYMIKPAQSLQDILVTIDILGTAVIEGSFGPLFSSGHANETDLKTWEKHLIDSITLLLIDNPKVSKNQKPYEEYEVLNLRLRILGLIGIISRTSHGGATIAANNWALGRLFRIVSDTLCSMYDRPTARLLPRFYEGDGDGDGDSRAATASAKAEIINTAMLVVYHIVSQHAIKLQDKLAVIHGGQFKLQLTLSRLAFCDATWLEDGISDATVENAMDILEHTATPEEIERLWAALNSENT